MKKMGKEKEFFFKDENGSLKMQKIFVLSASIVILTCVLYSVLMFRLSPGGMDKRGQFGDMFGFVGALFSGLAFAGLIVTMLQQREDIKIQKKIWKLRTKHWKHNAMRWRNKTRRFYYNDLKTHSSTCWTCNKGL